MFDGKVILITGGTGSFGKKFTQYILDQYKPKKIIIYSRDEYKQFKMSQLLDGFKDILRFFIGDVRDKDRLYRAFEGVDYVIHAAALKHVPVCEYNPFEAIKTNVLGVKNIIDAAIDCRVKKLVALSTDKAVNPINLYGATKLASDKLIIAANAYSGSKSTVFSVVRYGNVAGSRGSVIPFYKKLVSSGCTELPVTDIRMTRFWISLDQGIKLIMTAFEKSQGGEIFVSKIPSFKIVDLAHAICPEVKIKETGIREGEKLHETMITQYDSFNTYDFSDYFVIFPHFDWWKLNPQLLSGGKKVNDFFEYSSDTNDDWMGIKELQSNLEC